MNIQHSEMSVVETAVASGTGSILAYALLSCWRSHRNKTRVYGALMPHGKTYAQDTLVEDQRVMYIDLDTMLSSEKLNEMPLSKRMMEFFPKAMELKKKYMKDFRNRVIVLCSVDYELLKFLKLGKRVKAWLPTTKFLTDTPLGNKKNEIERLRMEAEIATEKKMRKYYNSYDDLSKSITEYYGKKGGKK